VLAYSHIHRVKPAAAPFRPRPQDHPGLAVKAGDLALADVDSVALDLAAITHGYHETPSPRRITAVRMVADPPRA
jgi:hypothetical protein